MAVDALKIIEHGYDTTISAISDFTSDLTTGQVAAATALGGAITGAGIVGVVSKVRKKRKATKRKTPKRKTKKRTVKRKKKLKFGSPAYRKKYLKHGTRKRKGKRRTTYARTAGKGKDRSTRRIRMTKHGQPYVILASGKARFIKKSSARRSRKLKGGRY